VGYVLLTEHQTNQLLLMATFIGFLKAGLPGAVASTVAIFPAPLLLAVVLGRWLARYRSRRPVRAALRGLTPAVVGTMATAAITLGTSLEGTGEIAIAGAVAMTLVRFQAGRGGLRQGNAVKGEAAVR
jgi:chromate transporter